MLTTADAQNLTFSSGHDWSASPEGLSLPNGGMIFSDKAYARKLRRDVGDNPGQVESVPSHLRSGDRTDGVTNFPDGIARAPGGASGRAVAAGSSTK
jgi:hypothetical protein